MTFCRKCFLSLLPFSHSGLLAGGAHSNSHEGCLVMTTLFFTGIAFISSIRGSVLADNFRIFFLIVFIISAVAITLWAPAENKNKPIKYEKKKGLKVLSYILLIIWALGINAGAYFSIFKSSVFFASALAVILQSFILSPAGFRLMEYTDSVIKGKEGKTNAQQT